VDLFFAKGPKNSIHVKIYPLKVYNYRVYKVDKNNIRNIK